VAGTIEVEEGVWWSGASWLYEWVLREISGAVPDHGLRSAIRDALDSNLGWFSVAELEPDVRRAVLGAVRQRVLADAERELAGRVDNPQAVLAHLRQLVDMADAPGP
jgi:hypothetical protein